MVFGASSGVGTAGIQIAKAAQARVFAVAGSDEKLKKAEQLGADVLLNYNTQDLGKEVKARTGGRGADVVFEHVGRGDLGRRRLRCLGKNGRLVTCGATTGPKVEIDLRFFFTQQHAILGAYMGSRHELLQCVPPDRTPGLSAGGRFGVPAGAGEGGAGEDGAARTVRQDRDHAIIARQSRSDGICLWAGF